ncbi:MAG: hypothetical protein KC766_01905 [Myxococcales bacterium]|nr:hypothetical protein [Myxococcales bacterium]
MMRLIGGLGLGVLALACVVSGCSSSDDGAKSDAGIAFEELPDELVKSTCQLLERCGGALTAVYLPNEECTTLQGRMFTDSDYPALKAAVADGRVVYHPTAARACLDAIANGGCDVLLGGLPKVCDDTIEGTTELDGECTVDGECGATRFCDADGACPGKCSERRGAGSGCGGDYACGKGLICAPDGTCAAPLPKGSACDEGGVQCAAGSFCFGATADTRGRCEDVSSLFTTNEGQSCDIAKGPLCSLELVCAPGSGTSGTCKKASDLGESCEPAFPDGCGGDAYCQLQDATSGTCVALPAAGETCAQVFGPQCQPFARCVNGTCRNLQRLGGNCEDDSMCYSDHCVGSVCKSKDACSR